MDIGRIVSRSLELMWKYKFLWVFALVMGLTSAGASGPNLSYQFNGGDNPFNSFYIDPVVIVIAACFGLVLFAAWLILFFYFRFVSRGALVDTVRAVENQENPTLRDAWQSGRKFYARLLGLGFLVNVPLALVSMVVLFLGFVPLIAAIVAQTNARGLSGREFAPYWITAAFAFCCALLCVVVLGVVIHPLYEMAVRAIVLEDLSVRDGLRRGIQRARAQLGNVLVVYIVLIGARFGYGMLAAAVMIPIGALMFFVALGLFPGNWNALLILGLLAAIPLWLLVGALEGVFQLFESNVWTEAYLQMESKETENASV